MAWHPAGRPGLEPFAKAMPSLGNPGKRANRAVLAEDLILFLGAVFGYLGGGIQSNFSFSDPGSQQIAVAGLVIGLAGKALVSLGGDWSKGEIGGFEDWVAFIAVVASALGALQWGTQFAAVGIFFGFLGKDLASSPGQPNPSAQGPSPPTPPSVIG